MGAMLERVVSEIDADLAHLKASIVANKSYHAALYALGFARPTQESISQQTALPFSTLEDVAAIASDIAEQIKAVREEVRESDIALVELQSRMLKSECNVGL